MRNTGKLTLAILTICCVSTSLPAITIRFDYTYDSPDPFFDTPEKRNALEAAGNFFENILTDDLAEIVPGGVNTWSIQSTRPNTGQPLLIEDLAVPSDTLVVLVGARDLPGGLIAESGEWTASVEGTQDWVQTVIDRGEPLGRGAGATDFGPWGDILSFDTTTSDGTPRQWHFGIVTQPSPDQFDFFSTALHQLGHILGLGRADAWKTLVDESTNQFTGPASQGQFGGPIQLEPSVSMPYVHWREGTMGTLIPGGTRSEALNTPIPPAGLRRLATDLDVAALADIGWELAESVPFSHAGDANEDRAFNQRDIVQVMQAGKYLTGRNANWGDGDWNDDGIFDQRDITAALATDRYRAVSFAADQTANSPLDAVAVPEPAGCVILGLGLVGLFTIRGIGRLRRRTRPLM